MSQLCYKCKKPVDCKEACEGLHRECFCEWFGLHTPQPFEDLVARSEKGSNEWSAITSSFFHGKFRKYSARLNSKNYILKVQQLEIPELPATEYLCNQIALLLGVQVPKHFYIRFQNELDTFVCENFMQDHSGSNLVHIYRFLDHPDQFNCAGLIKILEKEVKRLDEINRLVRLCLFDALIGNHDRHGRNLGLIQTGKHLRLAPFYDNPSYLAMEDPLLLGALHEPRGAIATSETNEPTMKDYAKEWLRLGFKDTVQEFRNQIDLPKINSLIENSFISKKRQIAFSKLIHRRFQELCNATHGL